MHQRQDYVHELLEAYRATPGTMGTVRRPDRQFAGQLYDRSVPLAVVLNALVLATARRLTRPHDAPPLPTVRSLAYFLNVIDEVLTLDAGDDYFHYLRESLKRRDTPR